jgi:hypothetical protein
MFTRMGFYYEKLQDANGHLLDCSQLLSKQEFSMKITVQASQMTSIRQWLH